MKYSTPRPWVSLQKPVDNLKKCLRLLFGSLKPTSRPLGPLLRSVGQFVSINLCWTKRCLSSKIRRSGSMPPLGGWFRSPDRQAGAQFRQETIEAEVFRLTGRLSSGRTSSQRGQAALTKDTDPSRCQPIRPPFDVGVAVATGDSRLPRVTPCRQAV
jgi:hypothetical protein